MEALREHRVTVYRTDEQGLVRAISDGHRIRIESENPVTPEAQTVESAGLR
jgi:beta-lactamase superfamily II metal-dependent hydrolase